MTEKLGKKHARWPFQRPIGSTLLSGAACVLKRENKIDVLNTTPIYNFLK
jgi:hypothetical protein